MVSWITPVFLTNGVFNIEIEVSRRNKQGWIGKIQVIHSNGTATVRWIEGDYGRIPLRELKHRQQSK
jgi:hypothetical protein